jgi:16S rRNA (cytosine1402-N4)-methyltransferase
MPRPMRSTSPGQHRPVLLDEVLKILDHQPGQVAVDCTVGWAGHAVELLRRLGPTGLLIGVDLDNDNLPQARERLQTLGCPYVLHHANFAGLVGILGGHGLSGADMVLADLGMSSMQVDDPVRGFSYARDGALDMRMDRTRGQSAAQLLAAIDEEDLRLALSELGDEPAAPRIAKAILEARRETPIVRTTQLAKIIREAVGEPDWRLHPKPDKWRSHPAARTFQALRLLVNRELGNLGNLLRVLPQCLRSGGRTALISFHSGEDRLVKNAFRDGLRGEIYQATSKDPIRPRFSERQANPRSRSAKLRWARLANRQAAPNMDHGDWPFAQK